MPADLLSHRLIFVTGKGGVGKTTVARALGMMAARGGQRVIVAELGGVAGIDEVQLAPGLFGIAIDPQAAMEEYLRVKAGPVGGVLAQSKLFAALAMATPGLRELLGMGKIWELAQLERRTRDGVPYDLVIVDAPATGHGVAALRTPRVFAQMARVGPIAHQAATIATTITDRSFTAVVAVSLAEEMPVRETAALSEALAIDGLALDVVVLNARYDDRFSAAETGAIRNGEGRTEPGVVSAALRAALSAQARADAQAPHAQRLADLAGPGLVSLPYLYCETIEVDQLTMLADMLERELERP